MKIFFSTNNKGYKVFSDILDLIEETCYTTFRSDFAAALEVVVSTIRAVASEADVSIATVSRVFNNTGAVSADVRDRVLKVADRLRYGAARRNMTNYIALAYTGPSSISSPYDSAIMEGVSEAAEAAGFDLVITQIKKERRSNETATQFLARKEIRGVL